MTNYTNERVARQEDVLSRLPPFSEETEATVLGCVLHYPTEVQADIDRLTINRNSFYDQRHRVIYDAIAAVMKEGKTPDGLTIIQHLQANGRLADAGGLSYVGTLPDCASVLFEQHVERLHDLRKRRFLLKKAYLIASRMHDLSQPLDTVEDDMEMIVNATGKPNKGLPPIVSAAEFIAQEIPEPRQLIYGVLHQGCKLVLGGNSKGRKTWTFVDLAVSIATGEPWFSFKTSKGKVLYLNFELQGFAFQKRLRAIEQAKGVKVAEGAMDLWNLDGHIASYTELFPKILEQIKTSGYSLIILDPIYRCYGDTDENSAGHVAKLLNAIGRLAVETGAAVAFAAHYAKGNAASKEAIDRISGSGVFARDPDAILNLTRHETDDAFVLEATLRNFKPVEPFVVRWDYPLMRRDRTLDPTRLKGMGGRPKNRGHEGLVALLKNPMTVVEWRDKAETELGVSKSAFYRFKQSAEEQGLVERTADGKLYITGAASAVPILGTGNGKAGMDDSQSQNPKGIGNGNHQEDEEQTRQE